jgi:hypothetical protein
MPSAEQHEGCASSSSIRRLLEMVSGIVLDLSSKTTSRPLVARRPMAVLASNVASGAIVIGSHSVF